MSTPSTEQPPPGQEQPYPGRTSEMNPRPQDEMREYAGRSLLSGVAGPDHRGRFGHRAGRRSGVR